MVECNLYGRNERKVKNEKRKWKLRDVRWEDFQVDLSEMDWMYEHVCMYVFCMYVFCLAVYMHVFCMYFSSLIFSLPFCMFPVFSPVSISSLYLVCYFYALSSYLSLPTNYFNLIIYILVGLCISGIVNVFGVIPKLFLTAIPFIHYSFTIYYFGG